MRKFLFVLQCFICCSFFIFAENNKKDDFLMIHFSSQKKDIIEEFVNKNPNEYLLSENNVFCNSLSSKLELMKFIVFNANYHSTSPSVYCITYKRFFKSYFISFEPQFVSLKYENIKSGIIKEKDLNIEDRKYFNNLVTYRDKNSKKEFEDIKNYFEDRTLKFEYRELNDNPYFIEYLYNNGYFVRRNCLNGMLMINPNSL